MKLKRTQYFCFCGRKRKTKDESCCRLCLKTFGRTHSQVCDKAVKTVQLREADATCRQIVFERDKETCVMCGSQQKPQWSHIYTRGYLEIRNDPDNSVVHCQACHCWFTHHHTLGISWFSRTYPERWARISAIVNPRLESRTEPNIAAEGRCNG